MPKGKKENEIQNEIFDYLLKKNVFFWRANNVPVYGKNNAGKYMYRALPKHTPKGIPDIIAIHEGVVFCLEVKREGARLSEHQAHFGIKVLENGGIYAVVRSVNDVQKVFEDAVVNIKHPYLET